MLSPFLNLGMLSKRALDDLRDLKEAYLNSFSGFLISILKVLCSLGSIFFVLIRILAERF